MKNHVHNFFSFSINEAKHHGKEYREYPETSMTQRYVMMLQKETIERMKGQEIEGWYVDPLMFEQARQSFMFKNDSIPSIDIFISPFFNFETGISREIRIFDGTLMIPDIKDVHLLMSGDINKDVNVIVELITDELRELISNNFEKLLEIIKDALIPLGIKDVFGLAVDENDIDATIWLMTIGFSPEEYFDSEDEMIRFYGQNSRSYASEDLEVLKKKLPPKVYDNIIRNEKTKNLFGI